MSPVRRLHGLRRCILPAVVLCVAAAAARGAAPSPGQSAAAGAGTGTEGDLVTYPAVFFDQYRPNTALDMVRQVPGFVIDDGGNKRGFGGAAGNILINDRRPSAKQDAPSDLLGRIPAANVARVELIRGHVRDIDLLGKPMVVNVILRKDAPAAIRWEVYLRHNNEAPLKPGGSISLADRWADIAYNAGLKVERNANGESGTDRVFDAGGNLIEDSIDKQHATGYKVTGNLNASTWLGENFVQLNTTAHDEIRKPLLVSRRVAHEAGGDVPRTEYTGNTLKIRQFELGVDAERLLQQDFLGKAIFLFTRDDEPNDIYKRVVDETGTQTLLRKADTGTVSTEAIARLEFDWAGWAGHNVQTNVEGAFNALDSSLLQTVDSGAGPVIVDVPGANTRVEELRGNVLAKDTWTLGNFEFEYGLGVEVSTITQTGDANLKRHFFYLKPRTVLTWAPNRHSQTRFRIEREVSQLDFNDFASATVYEDNDLALGNPNLRPETTWVAEVTEEWRFGRIGVVSLTAYYNWISDVLDLLPLTPDFEVPGNIGNGRRWGAELDGTLPLDWLGLKRARLSVTARWQDSRVIDPVTGKYRVLSADAGFGAYRTLATGNTNMRRFLSLTYRQDFTAARVAWGWTLATRAHRPRFKVNELDVYDEGVAIDAFVETTRWFGLKLRLDVEDALNYIQARDRLVFTGERDLSPVDYRLLRDRRNGRRIALSVSGNF